MPIEKDLVLASRKKENISPLLLPSTTKGITWKEAHDVVLATKDALGFSDVPKDSKHVNYEAFYQHAFNKLLRNRNPNYTDSPSPSSPKLKKKPSLKKKKSSKKKKKRRRDDYSDDSDSDSSESSDERRRRKHHKHKKKKKRKRRDDDEDDQDSYSSDSDRKRRKKKHSKRKKKRGSDEESDGSHYKLSKFFTEGQENDS